MRSIHFAGFLLHLAQEPLKMSYAMPPNEKIRADLVIIGGGFMGLSLARQALSRGLRPLVIERNIPSTPHYMTGLLAPRADYLRLDKEEVELTAYECYRWLQLFPDIIKPRLFLMPFHQNSPYSYNFLRPLMEYYDKITKMRLGTYFQPSSRINNAILEQMEPNLRKNYFDDALAFHELTVEPNELLYQLKKEQMFISGSSFITYPDKIVSRIKDGRIETLELVFKDRVERFLIENPRGFTVVNCAGPWIENLPGSLRIDLPVEYNLGFQITLSEKHLFQNPIITFGPDKKYNIIYQNQNHLQVGPTNTRAMGPEDMHDITLEKNALTYLTGVLKDTLEPNFKLKKAEIKSGGLRVKLRIPLTPDSNRPFVFRAGLENYHIAYPGKAVLALRTADELLAGIIDNKKFSLCLNGRRKTTTWLKLNLIWIKSLVKLGLWYCRDFCLYFFRN